MANTLNASVRSKLVGIGEILWDQLPTGKQLGGAPANFAFHARQLASTEIDSYVVSCIGDDPPGWEILSWLKHQSINSDYLGTVPHYETGSVDVVLNSTGTASYTINEPAAWDFIPNSVTELARNCSVVCFGSLAQRNPVSRTSIHAFVDNTPNHALRIFDINLRQNYYNKAIIEASLESTNILKINDEELSIIANILQHVGNEKQQLQSICETYNLHVGILTRADHGSLLVNSYASHDHPGYPADVIDTIGAGDAFTAAVAIGLLKQFDLDKINEYANRVAAFVCSKKGATPVLTDELKSLFN